jgi:formylglycine-generating enzyme required for sulfatase activity
MGLTWAQEDEWGRELLARVQERLTDLVAGGKLTPRERAEAGDTLARLGDVRPGVCTLEPDLIPIPAGTFLMGDERHEITLDAFAIARYPVTNAQFRHFVEDGGYTEKWRACWTKEGWQYRGSGSWREPRWRDDERLSQDNQPVVGVSWYEAVAYANWLSRQTGKPYRLPTEAEWSGRRGIRTAGSIPGRMGGWQTQRTQKKRALAGRRPWALSRPGRPPVGRWT